MGSNRKVWFPSVQIPEDVHTDLSYFKRKHFGARNWEEFLIKVRDLLKDLERRRFNFSKYRGDRR